MMSGKYPREGFACTESLDLKAYFAEYSQLVKQEMNLIDTDMESTIMGLEMTMLEKNTVVHNCSPDILSVEEEIGQEPIEGNIKLASELHLNFEIPRCAENLKVVQCKKKWSSRLGRVQAYPIPIQTKTVEVDQDLTAFEDMALNVKLYNPFRYTRDASYFKKDRISYSHEIVILASHTLADLRDKLLCSSDLGYNIELREPIEKITPEIKTEYPSGFLFIEGCFYNDMRLPNCIDYSEVIRKWAQEKSIAEFTSGDMSKTKIGDLKLRIGYPYLYQHQGDCEHVITFSDARLLRPSDRLSSSGYPYFLCEKRYVSITCFICGFHTSRFMVTECDRLPHKHGYFCKECLLSYNYIDGKKIGSFKLYPYYDRSSLMLT